MNNPAPADKGFWEPSPWYLAQTVHVLAGALVLLAAHVRGWDVGLVWLVFAGVTAFKEFLVDMSPFEGDTFAGSALDFVCYQLGAVAGVLAPFFFWWGTGIAAGTILVLFAVDLCAGADWTLPYD